MKWVLLCWWHFIKLIFLIILSAPNKIMGSWTHSCRSYSPLIIEDWMNIKYVMVIYSETPDTTYWLWDIETSMLSYDPVAKNYGWQELLTIYVYECWHPKLCDKHILLCYARHKTSIFSQSVSKMPEMVAIGNDAESQKFIPFKDARFPNPIVMVDNTSTDTDYTCPRSCSLAPPPPPPRPRRSCCWPPAAAARTPPPRSRLLPWSSSRYYLYI